MWDVDKYFTNSCGKLDWMDLLTLTSNCVLFVTDNWLREWINHLHNRFTMRVCSFSSFFFLVLVCYYYYALKRQRVCARDVLLELNGKEMGQVAMRPRYSHKTPTVLQGGTVQRGQKLASLCRVYDCWRANESLEFWRMSSNGPRIVGRCTVSCAFSARSSIAIHLLGRHVREIRPGTNLIFRADSKITVTWQ